MVVPAAVSAASSRPAHLAATVAAGAALGAVLLGQVALVGPAAAVPGLLLRTTFGPSDSVAKTQRAICPSGTRVIGGGGAVTGSGPGQVGLDIMLPLADANLYSVTGREDANGVAGNWAVTASALCAPPPAGLEVINGQSAINSVNPKFLELSCPAGKRVHGVGGEIVGGNGQVRLTEMRATSLTTVTVRAAEDEDGFGSDWKVRAYAVCAA